MGRKGAMLPALQYGAVVLQAPNTSAEAEVYWNERGRKDAVSSAPYSLHHVFAPCFWASTKPRGAFS